MSVESHPTCMSSVPNPKLPFLCIFARCPSDLGSFHGATLPLSNSARLEPPLHCPYCEAKASRASSGRATGRGDTPADVPVRRTELFCRPCQEFFCHTCFTEVRAAGSCVIGQALDWRSSLWCGPVCTALSLLGANVIQSVVFGIGIT